MNFKHVITTIFTNFVKFSVIFNLPKLTALLFLLRLKKLTPDSRKYKVLYLSKPVFNDDVKSLNDYGKEFSYTSFPRLLLNIVCSQFIEYFEELNDGNYHVKTRKDKNIIKLRIFLKEFMGEFFRYNKFDLVLAGNFVYTQQQELFLVIKHFKIPTVVIYKEGIFPIDRYDQMVKLFYKNKRFRADKMLFYNNKSRETLLKAKVPGLKPSQTALVGVPRFAYYRNRTYNDSEENLIVLFSFDPETKAKYFINDKKKYEIFLERSNNFHTVFCEFCIRNPSFSLIVKSKSPPEWVSYTKRVFDPYVDRLNNRLIITNSVPANELVSRAKYVAAYSSTTLIEALLLKKILICPDFTNLVPKKNSQDILHPYSNLAHYIESLSELEDLIKNISKYSYPEKDRLNYLNQMIHEPFGNSVENVEKEMKLLL
tara:strand:+ start:30539 stop:31816 length:1278 start_codon:yes stop_codon:yes gene_type:complete